MYKASGQSLVNVNDQEHGECSVRNDKNLKNAKRHISTIYTKKDVHGYGRENGKRRRKPRMLGQTLLTIGRRVSC